MHPSTYDLRILFDWMCYNKLSVNVDKTKCMHFGRSIGRVPMIKLNDTFILEVVDSYKYLGLINNDH